MKYEKLAKDANPEVEALKKSARKYYEEGKYDKAITELTKALRIAPDDAELYKKRGDAHFHKADETTDLYSGDAYENKKAEYKLAVEDYSSAIKLNPDYAEAFEDRGWIYAHLGNDQKALADYNQVIAIDPEIAFVYHLRGKLYIRENRLEAAIDDYSKAISRKKHNSDYWSRSEAYKQKGDLDSAFADFQEAVKKNI